MTDEEAAVRMSPLPAAILSSNLEFLQSNRAMARITGPRRKGRTLADVVDTRDRTDLLQSFAKLRSRSDSLRIEVRLGAEEPRPIALLIAQKLPRGSRGTYLACLVDLATVNYSERWSELLQDFERAASEWRRTFDAVELPIVIVDAELNVSRINRAARMLVGRQYVEIIGHRLTELGSSEPWSTISKLAKEVRETRSPAARQVSDSSERTLDILVMLFNAEDVKDSRVIAIVWDVSALIELQKRVEQQRTMATMGALVAGVAHEVRNPLFAISATVDAMEATSEPSMKEYFEVLREEIDRMTNLMQDLLTYGRPAAPVFNETTVGAVIDGAMRASSPVAQKFNVRLRKVLNGDATIVADRERLTRAVQNLIENAIQHSPAESEVCVSAQARKEAGGGYVDIRVMDRGPGFAADILSRVFEPFFSRRKGGTGLGLSLVQQIVTEHGGEVSAGNQEGGGGEVRIRLPLGR